jgi:hypothetical protein
MVLNIWLGTTDTDVDVATNWSLGHVPTTSEDVQIQPSDNDPETTGNFTIDGDLDILVGAKLTVNAGDTLTFTEDSKTLTVAGYLLLDGTSGSHAVVDFNSLASFTADITGYLEGNYADIENMNNAVPIDIEGGWIEMFNCTIACDVTWRWSGAARRLLFTGDDTAITNYGVPTLTTGSDVISFTTKYSGIEHVDSDIGASSNIVQSTGKYIKMGMKPSSIKIDGACLTSAWDVIEDFRALQRKNYAGNYRKVTFFDGDLPTYAISGYLELRDKKRQGPLWPKFYSLIIEESLF